MNTKTDVSSYTRDEWLNARMSGVGGSDVAGIMGISTYKDSNPLGVYFQKKGSKYNGSYAMETGNHMEPMIADFFERETGFKTEDHKFLYMRDGYLMANLDRWIPELGTFLEIKNMNMMVYNQVKSRGIPATHNLQIQHYMYVLGLDSCWYCAFGGSSIHKQEVKYDKNLYEGKILSELSAFWEHVESNVPPKEKTREEAKNAVKIPDIPNDEILFVEGTEWEKAIGNLRDLGNLNHLAF